MGLTLGGNNSSFKNIRYLSDAKSKMDKSLLRISSGKRILTAADDSGGLSVAMKLQNQINTTKAAQGRVENSKSFVEMQDTALSTAGDILIEMSSVKGKYDAEGSATTDAAKTYASQFRELQVQLGSLKSEKLNGVSLFSSDSSTSMTVYTSTSGSSGASVTLDNLDYSAGVSLSTGSAGRNLGTATAAGSVLLDGTTQTLGTNVAISVSQVDSSDLTTIISQVSGLRAESGGDLSTLGFASDYLTNMSTNMESAHGRIMDVDLAEESSNLAKYSMQYEAAAAAVAQANVAMGAVLDLLLGSINRK
ncbi:flagellin [Opitutales bacterium]|nr:flagellin [Opitutales bacterium]